MASVSQAGHGAAVTVRLHGAFRELAGGARTVPVAAASVEAALAALASACPPLAERLRDEHGRLREHLTLFVNGRDVRELAGLGTALGPGDVVEVIPALSGGGEEA